MGQKYHCGFLDSLLAEAGGVTMSQLHFDAPAIVRAYKAIGPLVERLGISRPQPRLAGFSYAHVAALGCPVIFPDNSEPKPDPIVATPADIDRLTEPRDYLAAPVIRRKLESLEALRALVPDASLGIGGLYEGPATTAALLMGQDFFTLPYDDPARAHALLRFCTETAIRYAHVILGRVGIRLEPGAVGIADDFAGMFPPPVFEEFVAPYWDMLYKGMGATQRSLHCELLRAEHMPFLKALAIADYDPTVNPYLSTAALAQHCPCRFESHIHAWEIYELSGDRLAAKYRDYASHHPSAIVFYMDRLRDEPKIQRLLQVARELA